MSVMEQSITLSFIYTFVFVVVIAGVFLSAVSPHAMRLFMNMPPVGAIYGSVHAEWITMLLHFGYGMTALANIGLGSLTLVLGMKSQRSSVKFLAAFLGIQLILMGLLCSAIVIILELGGMAHLVSVVMVISVALTTILTALMVVSKFKYIKKIIIEDQ